MKKLYIFAIVVVLVFSMSAFGQKYVLIHGWLGDGSVWNDTRVKSMIQNEMAQYVYQPSLTGTASSNTQALNLNSYLVNNSIDDAVAVSFSMGAMNTRRHLRNQFEIYEPQRIGYHFSIGGTHYGSPVATNLEEATFIIIAGAAAAIYPGWLTDDGSHPYYHLPYGIPEDLFWGAYILTGSELALGITYFIGGPALNDLKTTSTAVSTINPSGPNYYESNITKVGIVGTEIDPVIWRLMAGSFEIDENTVLDLVDYINQIRFAYLVDALLAWWSEQWPLEYVYPYVATWIYFMVLDDLWQTYAVCDNNSDGLVPKTMQEYPEAAGLYYAVEASHMEQKDHEYIETALRTAIHDNGPIPPVDPLSVYISGPSALQFKEYGTYTANVSGGFTPYSYQWYKKLGAGSWEPAGTSSTLQVRMGMQDITLKVVITDYWNQTAEDTHYIIFGINPWKQAAEEDDTVPLIPDEYILDQNYPNPFNPATNIRFGLPEDGKVTIDIFNIEGKKITTLADGNYTAGFHTVSFDGSEWPSGVYFYRINMGDFQSIKRMILLK
jgi:hypothetical protein